MPRTHIRYVDVSAVSRERLAITAAEHVPANQASSRARKIVKTGDTLFATIRPGLARIAQVPSDLDGEIASTAFCVLRPNRALVHPDFLFFAVANRPFVERVADLETGASYPAVRDSDVLDQMIPLPPLTVQGDIAATMNCVRKALLLEDGLAAESEILKRAAMRELFTRGLRSEPQKDTEVGLAPASWEVRRLEDDHDIAGGGTPLRSVDDYWTGGTIPWVKTAEVNYSVIHSTEEHITQAGLDNSSAKLLPPGTLLIAMFGQGVTRGRVAILGIEATCNQACAAVRPRNDRVDTRFLYHLLTSKYEELRQLAHGGQQQNLNIDIVRNFQVAVPPTRDEQQEIVAILDGIDGKIDIHRRKKAVLEELFKSLLHKLMTGEIRVADLDLSALDVRSEAEVHS